MKFGELVKHCVFCVWGMQMKFGVSLKEASTDLHNPPSMWECT